jgi:mitogen-activated protein kinase 1/3
VVAIKKIEIDVDSDITKKLLILAVREVEILYRLSKAKNNNFTLKLLDAFISDEAESDPSKLNEVYLVTDYLEHDLNKIFNQKSSDLSERRAVTLVYNILLSLKFIHSAGVVHRDLKPANILVNAQCQVKLCDFGLARTLQGADEDEAEKAKYKKRPLSPVAFTRWYRPPEVILQNREYDQQADVWSFACMLSEIIKCTLRSQKSLTMEEFVRDRILFKGASCFPVSPSQGATEEEAQDDTPTIDEDDQILKILQVLGHKQTFKKDFFESKRAYQYYQCVSKFDQDPLELADLHKNASPELIDLMEKCLCLDPANRSTVDDCIALPVFDSIRNDKLEKNALAPDRVEVKIDKLKISPESGKSKEYSNLSLQKYLASLVTKISAKLN